ncbi:MAG: peptide chain release factor N(5)-glutamine methyltransferase [Candidatus Omnitrophica bacterium]|nr:peptide chain release factor N(5)-glutamine methyltransferase [Candidatus Omnitrophota bacterium]
MNEKELILTSLLDCRRVDIYTNPSCLTIFQERIFQDILKRRQDGEPLQYLLGETEFMGLPFHVNPDVLIPRPETELLVQSILFLYREQTCSVKIADLGTGSGNIAVSLAKNINSAKIKAIDISPAALNVARNNAKRNGVADSINFTRQDIFKFFNDNNSFRSYDLIVSNPPYISQQGMRQLPRDVKHEPVIALYGGDDGLEFYYELINGAAQLLKDSGILALEIGEDQRIAIAEMFAVQKETFFLHFIKDFAGRDRVAIAQKAPVTMKEKIANLDNKLKQ